MSAMASLAECRLLRTQATDTGQTAIGPIVLKKSDPTAERPIFSSNDSKRPYFLNHCCAERVIHVSLIAGETWPRSFSTQ